MSVQSAKKEAQLSPDAGNVGSLYPDCPSAASLCLHGHADGRGLGIAAFCGAFADRPAVD